MLRLMSEERDVWEIVREFFTAEAASLRKTGETTKDTKEHKGGRKPDPLFLCVPLCPLWFHRTFAVTPYLRGESLLTAELARENLVHQRRIGLAFGSLHDLPHEETCDGLLAGAVLFHLLGIAG